MFSRSLLRTPYCLASRNLAAVRFISFDAASQPRIRIGSKAPDFTAETTDGKLNFYDYLGNKWGVLFSHPADFTPVCTTELGQFALLKSKFDARDVKLIGLSTDDLESHKKWINDIKEISLGGKKFNFPVIADTSKEVSYLYDMVDDKSFKNLATGGPIQTIRSVFIIDPKKTVRLILTYPPSVGRNSAEVLRVIDSLQIGDAAGVVTPVDWKKGDKVIIPPSVSPEDAIKKFGEGINIVTKYLRYAHPPKK